MALTLGFVRSMCSRNVVITSLQETCFSLSVRERARASMVKRSEIDWSTGRVSLAALNSTGERPAAIPADTSAAVLINSLRSRPGRLGRTAKSKWSASCRVFAEWVICRSGVRFCQQIIRHFDTKGEKLGSHKQGHPLGLTRRVSAKLTQGSGRMAN